MTKHVVVIGGGIGGLATAYNLKKISKDIRITLISDRPYFGFTPAYPHLAMGWRRFEDITVPLGPVLSRAGVEFINERAERIDPDLCKVWTSSGREIGYDYLVIATGPKLVFEAEGMEENSASICTAEHAAATRDRFEALCRDPGPVVVGAIPGVSCFGPAYEFALMVHHELVKRGLRRRVSITYVTSEPYLGHLGLGGIGTSRRLMEDLFAEKDIRYVTNVKVKAVERERVVYEDLEGNTLCRDPGPVVVGAIPGVSCFGPAYEFALMVHHELVKRGLRRRVSITYVTSEPYLGHLGLGGIGTSRRLMEDLFAEKDIRYVTNVKVKAVERERVVYEDLEGNTRDLPSKFTMLMPKFAGPEVVLSAGSKVAHPKNGMVIVNKCFQNPSYGNVYGVGVVAFIPPVDQTPVPTGTPKTGQMIEGMARAVALNIVADIKGLKERYAPTLAALCIADMGDEGIGFLANPVIPPRIWVKSRKGRWVHWAKTAFERYFLWKVKRGNIYPSFEEFLVEKILRMKAVEPCDSCEGSPT